MAGGLGNKSIERGVGFVLRPTHLCQELIEFLVFFAMFNQLVEYLPYQLWS